ncbi:MAG: hypothetical protein PUB20_01410 [Clostridia bacterium]|nr:hypothetical protein [Clostridia bacterium]
MDSIVALPIKIVEWLDSREDMDDLKFFVEYPPENKAVPLKRAIVAVGIDSVSITDKFVMNDDGVLEKQEYCRLAEIKVNLSICVPFSKGGQACHDIFTRITDALVFRTDLNIVQSGCDKIESDRDTDALVMTGWLMIEADFCPAESTDESFTSFFDKQMICGSHVRDTEIHVTAEDKEAWNDHFVTGFYSGTGATTRSFTLGFKAKLVLVFSVNKPLLSVDFTNSAVTSNSAAAIDGYGTSGLSVTSSGFKISKGESGNSKANLNEAAINYFYIAFK